MNEHEQMKRLLKAMDVADPHITASDASAVRRLDGVLAAEPSDAVQTVWQLPARPPSTGARLWAGALAAAVLVAGIFLVRQFPAANDGWLADWGRDPVERAVDECRTLLTPAPADTDSPADAAERVAAARPILVQRHGLEASVLLTDGRAFLGFCSVEVHGGGVAGALWDTPSYRPAPDEVVPVTGRWGALGPDATAEFAGVVGSDVAGMTIPGWGDAVITVVDGFVHVWTPGRGAEMEALLHDGVPAIVTLSDGTTRETMVKFRN